MPGSGGAPMSEPKPKSRSSHRARWGLLVVTAVMGLALVITGVVGYLGAARASDVFARGAASAMMFAVKRDVFRAAENPQDAVDLAIEEMGPQGLVFAGIFDRRGELLYSAGAPQAEFDRVPTRKSPGKLRLEPLDRAGTVRALAPIKSGRRDGRMRDERAGRGGRPRQFLVIDVQPRIVGMIMSRALITLAITIGAALILAIAATVFWRLSRRADAIEAQLARDQRLKALGQMSAVLGHELRNPLASLKGHAQLLLEKLAEDHPGRRGAETVVEEARRLERLSGQVLDFARTGEVAVEPTDPAALVRGAVERAAVDPLELHLGDAPSSWRLDPGKMEQVLVNLLDNARQASPAEAVVELSLRERGRRLVLEVRDRGAGIEPEELERIFEPFFTTRVHGTGLGLALARRIVEEHGGRIEAANHPDGGAVIRIELPSGAAEDGA
jgi:two-component system sensor histidine kinase HydH